ncbi:GNAT family N-acetyltransferase [Oscillibacter sp. MSJ-2]|uniref:GNAT family N-acetyltransferase n=1 Tax=Dysosmobacter acutus TaxID=2841504 RepID=A0ABS6F9F6_9FIRM|nr:GNAT family N-acetyltransferase [Dysosmobacter acutus]MBU5626895.1 GNAT family N-acetyltransferase [Dysosmobacter acutus]
MEISIRMATAEDAEALVAIYAPYVEQTAISFEYEVPAAAEFAGRIQKTLERYPYLVAERDGKPMGYAYASAFHDRAAYSWAVECSVYVEQGCRRGGVGRRLYQTLEELLARQNVLNVYACIAYPNPGSIAFHQHMGYRTIGHFTQCGYKLGRWWDMVWMEKMLAGHPECPEPLLPVGTL